MKSSLKFAAILMAILALVITAGCGTGTSGNGTGDDNGTPGRTTGKTPPASRQERPSSRVMVFSGDPSLGAVCSRDEADPVLLKGAGVEIAKKIFNQLGVKTRMDYLGDAEAVNKMVTARAVDGLAATKKDKELGKEAEYSIGYAGGEGSGLKEIHIAILKDSPFIGLMPQVNELLGKYIADGTIQKLIDKESSTN